MQLLLVESRQGIADAIKTILQQNGYETTIVSSAYELQGHLKRETFAGVVLHDALRDSYGRHLCPVIKQQAAFASVPIVVYSSLFHISSAPYIHAINADATLMYPFSSHELLQTLSTIISPAVSSR